MVWHVQHHTAKTRSLSRLLFKIAPFWWNIGTWIPGSSEYWTFVWVHKQCPARMDSVHPKNVTYFCFKDPDDWLFALSPMGYWCWQGPLEERLSSVSRPSPLFVVLEWFQSVHGGLTYVPPSRPLHMQLGVYWRLQSKLSTAKIPLEGLAPSHLPQPTTVQ